MTKLNELDQNEMHDVANYLGVDDDKFKKDWYAFLRVKRKVEANRAKRERAKQLN